MDAPTLILGDLPETRRLRLNGQSTSIRLENAFWDVIDSIAENEGTTASVFISRLHSEVLERRGEPQNFTSLLRCACLMHSARVAQQTSPAQMAAE